MNAKCSLAFLLIPMVLGCTGVSSQNEHLEHSRIEKVVSTIKFPITIEDLEVKIGRKIDIEEMLKKGMSTTNAGESAAGIVSISSDWVLFLDIHNPSMAVSKKKHLVVTNAMVRAK